MSRTAVQAVRFTPINDRLLIKPNKEEEKVGGLYLADVAKEKPQRGKVIVAGPGKTEKGFLQPMTCKAGDEVCYGKYAGQEIKIDGEDYVILREEEVFGIF